MFSVYGIFYHMGIFNTWHMVVLTFFLLTVKLYFPIPGELYTVFSDLVEIYTVISDLVELYIVFSGSKKNLAENSGQKPGQKSGPKPGQDFAPKIRGAGVFLNRRCRLILEKQARMAEALAIAPTKILAGKNETGLFNPRLHLITSPRY